MNLLVLCTNGRRLTPPNMLVKRPPAAEWLFEKSLGRGLSPVKKPERLPEGGQGLRFVCPSPSCNAPSRFWPTTANLFRVGASSCGSPTSGFPSGRVAAPPSGRRDKPYSVQMAPRSPLGSRCKSTPWVTPSG